jgi:sec-independent protein translocase protein TatA
MNLGTPELLLIIVIIVLLFGVGRISKISGEIGSSIKAFREGITSEKEKDKKENENTETKAQIKSDVYKATVAATAELTAASQDIKSNASVPSQPIPPPAPPDPPDKPDEYSI